LKRRIAALAIWGFMVILTVCLLSDLKETKDGLLHTLRRADEALQAQDYAAADQLIGVFTDQWARQQRRLRLYVTRTHIDQVEEYTDMIATQIRQREIADCTVTLRRLDLAIRQLWEAEAVSISNLF
jgi:hypothetical protein